MKVYQEILLIPDMEISDHFLWSKVFKQIHLALVDIKNQHGIENIGISFPNYVYQQNEQHVKAKLGNKLRIFAHQEQDLSTLNLEYWFKQLMDYVHIKPIREVGQQATSYVVVRRYRHNNIEKVAQQFARFKNISYQEALEHCKKHKQKDKRYPFIRLTSETNRYPYRLAIWQEQVDQPVLGNFNCYGINNQKDIVTVPHW